MRLEFSLPLKAETLNVRLRKHPMAQHREKVRERQLVDTLLPKALLRPLVRVTLVRVGPRALDAEDNLPGSLKAVRDAVAKVLRLDDASPLVEWRYDQQPGEHAVKVVVEAIGQLPPDTRPPPKPWQLPPRVDPVGQPREAKRESPRRGPKKASSIPSAPRDLRALATPATYRPGGKR